MSWLALEGLEKTFPDGTRAVRGVDLAFERGELVVLLGPSGCGKTTTLRMIAGLELPSAGRIVLDGRDVTRLRPSERDVGFVFQFYALYPHLSVRRNVAFPLECAGVPRAERERRVADVAARLGLEPLLDREPRGLPGGDQQRVALARAMVRKPAVYLMDEPLGTLDTDRRLEMGEQIRAQQLAQRVTTVYVTHDQDEAMRLADRIVVMQGGVVEQHGTPAELYDEPASLFVARFVGSPGMNLVEGELSGTTFRAGGVALELPRAPAEAAGAAVLGLRPEHVRVDPRGALRGRVVVDEYLGSHRSLHVETAAGTVVARERPDAEHAAGTEVPLALDLAHASLFDARTERRIAWRSSS